VRARSRWPIFNSRSPAWKWACDEAINDAMGSGGGGGGTTAGAAGALTESGTGTAWAFGFGFEPHAVVKNTTAAAAGHHGRVVMLGAPARTTAAARTARRMPPLRSPPSQPSSSSRNHERGESASPKRKPSTGLPRRWPRSRRRRVGRGSRYFRLTNRLRYPPLNEDRRKTLINLRCPPRHAAAAGNPTSCWE
jgi:hypothetical protein